MKVKKVIWVIAVVFSICSCMKESNSFIRVSQKNPSCFEMPDGQCWIPVSINICWALKHTNTEQEKEVLEKYAFYFDNFAKNGGNSVRIWLSAHFFEIEDSAAGFYNPLMIRRIDSLINLAKKYDIKLKFCIDDFRKITDCPLDSPRCMQFNKPYLSVVNNGPFKDMSDYVNTQKGKECYLNRLKILAGRYGDNPVVYGWELWNEMSAISCEGWYDWSKEILDSVKMMLPNQMIIQTIGSLDCQWVENDYKRLCSLNNDYITIHRYLDQGAVYEACKGPVDVLIRDAVMRVEKLMPVKKPIVFNEIGAVEPSHSGPSKLYDIDSAGMILHDMIFAPFFCGTAGCGAMWHWDHYVEKHDLWYHYKRFSNAIEGLNPIEENFTPFYFSKDSIHYYGLKGNKTIMIWCRDAGNNWKTELIDKAEPKINHAVILKAEEMNTAGTAHKIETYDPWEDHWDVIIKSENKITLPDFKRSIIIKITL